MPIQDNFVTPLQQLFFAPIAAVVQADFMAARQFVQLLSQYAFVSPLDDPNDYLGELRMVRFSYEQAGQDGTPTVRVFSIPAISLIPLPLLEVKEAVFEFGVHLLDAVTQPTHPTAGTFTDPGEDLNDPSRLIWRAMIARGSATQNVARGDQVDLAPHIEANINAKVTVGQAGIPSGIANLLALVGENAQVSRALLTVVPSYVNVTDIHLPVKLVIKAYPASGAKRPFVQVTYHADDHFELQAGGEVWKSGEAIPVNDAGNIDALLLFKEHLADGHADLTFTTNSQGLTSTAKFTCTY
jgi:Protein of unknown function (DUF2589)